MSVDSDRLDAILAEYLQAVEAGQAPDRAELLQRHPDLAGQLAAYFANEDRFRQLATYRGAPADNTLIFTGPKPPASGPADAARQKFDDYEIIDEIAAGGMGVVYRARQIGLNRMVALKMLRGRMASADEVRRFREEAERVSGLDHPHIIPIYDVGEVNGQPYFSMKLMAGGALRHRSQDLRKDLRAAARLMVQIARAVHFAHQRGILHRDLKPANVLLDRQGDPYVSDFGLAKPISQADGKDGEPSLTGSIEGTPAYMAPEQARGVRRLTTAADVYGLGAILYDLLTGQAPFTGPDVLSILTAVIGERPEAPRSLNGAVDRDLEIICLKCLAKEPADRYKSAEALADDLDRWLAGEPIRARKARVTERVWRWGQRRPFAAGLALTAIALLLLLIGGAISVARDRQAQLVELAVRKNAADARHVASTVLLRLQGIAAFVEAAAEDPRLLQLLQDNDAAGLRAFCQELDESEKLSEVIHGGGDDDPVASWMVLDAKGTLLAVSHGEGVRDPRLPGRDYFCGAVADVDASDRPFVHVSRAYLSQNQRIYKFGMTAAVHEPGQDGALRGVIGVTLATGGTLGTRLVEGDQQAVLALPADVAPPHEPRVGRPPIGDYLIVVHPAYQPRQEALRLPNGMLPAHVARPGRELQLAPVDENYPAFDNYQDPVAQLAPQYAGRWLAGASPVGNTEFVVIVQEPYAAVIASDWTVVRQLSNWLGVTLSLGAAATVVLLVLRARSMKSASGRGRLAL